jgi:hypothetical protein
MSVWLRRTLWVIGTLVLTLLIIFLLFSYVFDEPLRAYLEREVNEPLQGYVVTLEDVDVNPLGPSLVLKGATIRLAEHPEPPIAYFREIRAGVHWRPILRGRIVGHLGFNQPEIYIDLELLREEVPKRDLEEDERSWQEAVKSIQPLEINLLTITDGVFAYIDQDPDQPLLIERIFLTATNLRNFETHEDGYPASFDLEARIFDGYIQVQGDADLLAQPLPNATADIDIGNISLSRFAPIFSRYNIYMSKGLLNASGNVAHSSDERRVHLNSLRLHDLLADYIYTQTAEPEDGDTGQEVKEATEEISDHPEILLRIDHLQVQGDVGFVNQSAEPAYRVFLADADMRIDNLSNQFRHGPAEMVLNGLFMGSGDTTLTGTFRAEDQGPDFDLSIRIEGTNLPAMNDLFRAYGNFDISDGSFSFFSEMQVRQNEIDGYVRPFFYDVEVFDERDDEEKGLFREMYEGLVEGLVGLLTRRPEDRLAGRTEIAGEIDEPEVDTWQLVFTIIQNAFFQAILPGFEGEISESE